MNIGDKVVVRITNSDHWSNGALATMQGHTGVVAEVKTHHNNAKQDVPLKEPAYLVKFDPPLASWWRGGSPVTGFWFDEAELEAL